jgi:hypothetical protein
LAPGCGACLVKWQFERRTFFRRQIYLTKILNRKDFASRSGLVVHYSPRMKEHALVAMQQSRFVVAVVVSRFFVFVLDWYVTRRSTICSWARRTSNVIAAMQYGI